MHENNMHFHFEHFELKNRHIEGTPVTYIRPTFCKKKKSIGLLVEALKL